MKVFLCYHGLSDLVLNYHSAKVRLCGQKGSRLFRSAWVVFVLQGSQAIMICCGCCSCWDDGRGRLSVRTLMRSRSSQCCVTKSRTVLSSTKHCYNVPRGIRPGVPQLRLHLGFQLRFRITRISQHACGARGPFLRLKSGPRALELRHLGHATHLHSWKAVCRT